MIRTPQIEEYKELWKNSGSSVLQSWAWGEAKPNWQPVRLILNNTPVNIFLRKIPVINKYFGYSPRIFAGGVPSKEELVELINYSKNELKLSHLILEPQLSKGEEIFKSAGFTSSGKTIQPNQTNVVNLTKTEEELWMGLKGKYRRNIKKSERDGCEVVSYDSGDEIVQRFYSVMEEIFKRTSYVMYDISYFQKVWGELSKEKLVKIYIATNKGLDVGAYLVTFDTKGAYEFYGGTTDAGRNVEAGYLLKWRAIQDARNMGLSFYDHWGIAPYDNEGNYDKSHELFNISLFKEGFGGEKVQYLKQQTFTFDSFSQKVFKLGEVYKEFTLQIKKRL